MLKSKFKSKLKSKFRSNTDTITDINTNTSNTSNTPSTPSTPSTANTTLPSASTATPRPSPPPPLLRRSTSTLLTPVLATTSLPLTIASTLYTGLKTLTTPVATAIGLRKKRPLQSRTAKIFANARRHEDLDEWQEIDKRAVKEEMREERARRKRMGGEVGESEDESESEGEGEGEGQVVVRKEGRKGEGEVHPLQKPGRKRFRRWDDCEDEEEEGEVVEVDGVPVVGQE